MSNGNGKQAVVNYNIEVIVQHLDQQGIRVEVFSSYDRPGRWTCRMYPRDTADIKTVGTGERAPLMVMWSDIMPSMPMAVVDAYKKLLEHAAHVDAALPLPLLANCLA